MYHNACQEHRTYGISVYKNIKLLEDEYTLSIKILKSIHYIATFCFVSHYLQVNEPSFKFNYHHLYYSC